MKNRVYILRNLYKEETLVYKYKTKVADKLNIALRTLYNKLNEQKPFISGDYIVYIGTIDLKRMEK